MPEGGRGGPRALVAAAGDERWATLYARRAQGPTDGGEDVVVDPPETVRVPSSREAAAAVRAVRGRGPLPGGIARCGVHVRLVPSHGHGV